MCPDKKKLITIPNGSLLDVERRKKKLKIKLYFKITASRAFNGSVSVLTFIFDFVFAILRKLRSSFFFNFILHNIQRRKQRKY